MMRAARFIALLSLPLTACGGEAILPGGAPESDAAALNDAAAMLDANAVTPQSVGIENGEIPK